MRGKIGGMAGSENPIVDPLQWLPFSDATLSAAFAENTNCFLKNLLILYFDIYIVLNTDWMVIKHVPSEM